MGKLAIIATVQVAEGRRDELVPILAAHRDRCLRDEPGTRQFDILAPRDEPDKVMLYEVYDDDAAFKAHWEGASVARAKTEAEGLMLGLSGTFCELRD